MPGLNYYNDIKLWWVDPDARAHIGYDYAMRHIPDMDMAIALCDQHRSCVQAGCYVGLWPRALSQVFQHVLTFEPEPSLYEASGLNLVNYSNVRLFPFALGAAHGFLPVQKDNQGMLRYAQDSNQSTPMVHIDSLELNDCDALFLDVEGAELLALTGARETILRCRPVIHVEEWMGQGIVVQDFLYAFGYHIIGRVAHDVIYASG